MVSRCNCFHLAKTSPDALHTTDAYTSLIVQASNTAINADSPIDNRPFESKSPITRTEEVESPASPGHQGEHSHASGSPAQLSGNAFPSSKETIPNGDVEKGPVSSSSESLGAVDEAGLPVSNGGAEVHDENIVWWDEPTNQDPTNPLNWSTRRKFGNIAILSGITLVTPLGSSIFAPVVPDVMAEFHNDSQSLATFVVSVYLLGFAFGPLVVAPLSELYGRLPVYHTSNVLFVIFTIACAVSTSLNMLIGFRFLAGLAGSTVLTNGGGTIADMIVQEKRGGAMAPIVGPVVGGYLGEAKGWRWVFWLLVMLAGVFDILCFIFCRETYAPVILERKALRLRKETGNPNLRSKMSSGLPPREFFKRSIIRPTKLLLFSPICTILCIYTAIIYGTLYLLFTTFTYIFEGQYGFSSGSVGLTYIGIGIGMILGMAIFGGASDRILKAKTKNGEMKPEYRLPPLVPGSFCVPIGLFIYGWTAQYHEQWAVPLFGTLVVGIGVLAVFMAIQTYLVDAFTIHAASAVAANTVIRSIFGACFPLFGLQMYNALGLGWGNSLIAFIALALCPVPMLLLRYGESIRKNPRFQLQL
ncbi:MAG: hypothetical protein M1822_003006 [Bathelium mastoideum]|nr:MAG: hypothetical protein M1822_003006 [Bathelium mastoideum]